MSRLLTALQEPRGSVPQPGEYHLETAFCTRGRLRPVGLSAVYRQQLGDHYAHLIRRRPLDLDTHIRRIFLLQGLQRRHSLLGAVTDLFIALDGKGEALRHDLVAHLSTSLSRQQMETLTTWAAQGARAADCPATSASLLRSQVSTGSWLIRTAGKSGTADADALAEALEYLQHGQVENARDLLEDTLLDRPDDTALASELLAIYRHAREPDRLQSLQKRLRERGSRLPDTPEWQETQAFLQADATS